LVNLTDPIPPLEELSKQLVHKICIVIDGSTLAYALQGTKETRDKFFRLALLANSVICCRVSPKQKADVVHLAKSNGPWKTLSIGDGANDVSMIMEAHIGVGIYGKEGAQAVRSADFAIGQFAYLKKLLLYHGRLNYRRISSFILYYFYKNVIVVFTEIYFAFYNGFSGQIYFAEWLPMLYNSLWTSWPCMSNYLLDRVIIK
jgi:ATPase, P-type (transporting), HAD superfamily, subfamily IC